MPLKDGQSWGSAREAALLAQERELLATLASAVTPGVDGNVLDCGSRLRAGLERGDGSAARRP